MADPTLYSGLDYSTMGAMLGISATTVAILFAIIGIWSLVWKGFSLWKAAGKKSIPWFIALLIFNTVGILDILYIFVFSKINFKKKIKIEKPKKKK